jgi:hypothetical protein
MAKRPDYGPLYLYGFQHLGESRDERVAGFLASLPPGENAKKGSFKEHFRFVDAAYRAWELAGWDIVPPTGSGIELPSIAESSRNFKNDACFLYAAEHFEESSESVLVRFKDAHREVKSAHRYLPMGRKMLSLLRQHGWTINGPTPSSGDPVDQNRETGSSGHSNGTHTSGAAAGPYVRYVKEYEININPSHDLLQRNFEAFLASRGVTDLHPNLANVDLRYRDPANVFVLAEIKPCDSQCIRFAIRTAIGQLLDYK